MLRPGTLKLRLRRIVLVNNALLCLGSNRTALNHKCCAWDTLELCLRHIIEECIDVPGEVTYDAPECTLIAPKVHLTQQFF